MADHPSPLFDDAALTLHRPRAVLLGAARYRRHNYGANHPLAIPRVSLLMDLIAACQALTVQEFQGTRQATQAELTAFHRPDYVAALWRAQAAGKVDPGDRERYAIGTLENPWFPGFYTTPATAAYASIQGAALVLDGQIAFNPAGGMHHAGVDRARGFCFLNDPVLAILRLRQEAARVLYVDIDAHHGDGVEAAFRTDPGVMTLSLHMDTAYAYPFVGGDIEAWGPLGNAVNLPLPQAVNDAEYQLAFGALLPACGQAFQPDVIVLQAGTDILGPDPLGKFHVSTQCFLEIVAQVLDLAPRASSGNPSLLVLGGGGYHPLALARCWIGVWALLSGRNLPDQLPVAAQACLRAVAWDVSEDPDALAAASAAGAADEEPDREWLYTHRIDPVRTGKIRDTVRERVATLLRIHPALKQLRQ